MSNLVDYAKSELERAGMFDSDSDYNGALGPAVLKIVEEFSKEGHSGASAGIAIRLLTRLLRFKPITPITGADEEWMEVGTGMYQNMRNSSVFKQDGYGAYDIDAPDNRALISFPYNG